MGGAPDGRWRARAEETGSFVERVAALDVGKAGLVACLRVPSETRPGRCRQEVAEHAAMTGDLLALAADRLVAEGVELVVMQPTTIAACDGRRLRWSQVSS